MGFALWIEDDTCFAQGTHEYRPMGLAVISRSDHFRSRDFQPRRRYPSRNLESFQGFFASLGDLNQFLERNRGDGKKKRKKGYPTGVSIL